MQEYQRTGHRIKLNHSGALPRYIISMQVTANKVQDGVNTAWFSHRFRSVSCVSGRLCRGKIYGKQAYTFHDAESFWQWLEGFTRPNYTTWLIGKSILPQLILCGMPQRFQCGAISIDRPRSKRKKVNADGTEMDNGALAVIESPPTIIGIRVGSTQGRLVAVDLLNWFPSGIPTDETAKRPKAAEACPNRDNNDRAGLLAAGEAEKIHNHFTRLIEWVSDNDMGLFRYTASGQAFGAYRHRFMKQQIYVHDNTQVQRQERKAYFGGRSDMFRSGLIRTMSYQLDVNALFPAAMRDGWFPYCLSRYEHRGEFLALLPAIDWSASVAEVEICTNKPLYPLRTDRHVIYPIGRFRTVLCGQELYRAAKQGCILAVGSWSEYKLGQLFHEWVTVLWQMRQEYKRTGNSLYEQFTKFTMNSLYGKFAQLTPGWVNVTDDYTMLPWTTESRRAGPIGEWVRYRSIGWQVQKLCERKERPSSFYAISAFVTSAARVRMDNYRIAAGRHNVLYQGVDSLIVNQWGYDNLIANGDVSQTEIGKLRLEHSADFGEIRGISDYELGHKVVLSSRAINSEVTDLGDVIQHRQYIKEHLFKDGPIDNVIEKLEPWERQATYAKGVVSPDGWVEPFELGGNPMSALLGSKPDPAAIAAS